jgi:hypothetical protein
MRRRENRTLSIVQKSGTALFFSLLATGHTMQVSYAGELAYGFGYFGEFSDNIRRTPTNQQDEWINSVIAGIAYRENGPELDAHVNAQAEYRNYMNDTYNDGPLYDADAFLRWKISPQRFDWVFIDRADQLTRDVTQPNTPGNWVNTNVLSTGPDLFFRLGPVNTLELGLRYGRASYSDSNLDNNNLGAFASWQYAVNTETTYSLNYLGQDVRYVDDVLNDNFTRQDAFFEIDRHNAVASFLLDAGVTRIHRDQVGDSRGNLFRLAWTQQLTPRSSAGVLLASEYQDAGTVLLSTATSPIAPPGVPPTPPVTTEATTDIFHTKRAEIFYASGGSSFALNARAYYRDINYQLTPQDRLEGGGFIAVTYNSASFVTTTVYGSHLNTHYLSFVRDDRASEIGIRFLRQINRNVSATLNAGIVRNSSTDPTQEYTDRRVLLSLQYSSGPLFTPARR